MANSQTYLEGFTSDGTQVTTLAEIQGAGLKLPTPTSEFINIRSPGKVERLFTTAGNSNTLYTKNKPQDLYLKGPLASQMFIYTSIEEGQKNKTDIFKKPTSNLGASLVDGTRITKFLKSNRGINFVLNQVFLQGFQPFDETKVYNPTSPILAALRTATFGLADYPTRHVDTSNILGGLLGGTGLGNLARGIFGGGGPTGGVPAPPRSSVASDASRGLGLSTFTSLLGGADRSDQVVSPLARPDVRDLLRGQTATNAYSAYRYSKLVSSGGGNFFSKLLGSVGKFLQNNTIVGGIVPPKQPWAAKYRADEQTYDLYLNAGKLFDDSDITPTKSGGILSGIKRTLGIGVSKKFTGLHANQRFYHGSLNKSSMLRYDSFIKTYGQENQQDSVGVVTFYDKTNVQQISSVASSDFVQNPALNRFKSPIVVDGKNTTQLKYTDVVKADRNNGTLLEQSDQLLNYKVLFENVDNLPNTFSDQTKTPTEIILKDLDKAIENITGNSANDLYSINFIGNKNAKPLQFAKYGNQSEVGMSYLEDVKTKYTDKFTANQEDLNFPTRLGKRYGKDRFIQPTNNVDYVNSLTVLNKDEFDKKYGDDSEYGKFGPDIIKFYFYDIVNEKYIPFSATVKGIQDSNTAEWESIEYLGRPDKLYYYKGFTRDVNFNFVVNAHSIKELMPMWSRINYLTGLTRPANYTLGNLGGFMVPPMVQLTLGDFYKNHFVVIKSCNVNIPDDASWETIPENMTSPNNQWSWGSNRAYQWSSKNNLLNPRGEKGDSEGKFAQFPRTAEISLQMSVLEKDRPSTGRAIWGDAPIRENELFFETVKGDTFSENVRFPVGVQLNYTS